MSDGGTLGIVQVGQATRRAGASAVQDSEGRLAHQPRVRVGRARHHVLVVARHHLEVRLNEARGLRNRALKVLRVGVEARGDTCRLDRALERADCLRLWLKVWLVLTPDINASGISKSK